MILIQFIGGNPTDQAILDEIKEFPDGSRERHEAMGFLFSLLARKEWVAADRVRQAQHG